MSGPVVSHKPQRFRSYSIAEFVSELRKDGWEVGPFKLGNHHQYKSSSRNAGVVGVKLDNPGDLFVLGQLASEGGHDLPCPILVYDDSETPHAVFQHLQWAKVEKQEKALDA